MPRRQAATVQPHDSHLGTGSPPVELGNPLGALSSTQELGGDSRRTWSRFRFLPLFGYHHVLMMIGCGPILLLSLVLAGCTTTGTMQNLHVASFVPLPSRPPSSELMMNETLVNSIFDCVLEIMADDATHVEEVRAGYFSICARLEPGGWQCGIKTAAAQVLAEVSDPLGLVNMAHQFRTKTINPGLVILCIILDLLLIIIFFTFPGWHEEDATDGDQRQVKPFPSRVQYNFSLICSSACTLGLYIAVAWQHIAVATAAASVDGLRYGIVEVGTGSAPAALAWLSVFLSFTCTVGVGVMIISIRVLTQQAADL